MLSTWIYLKDKEEQQVGAWGLGASKRLGLSSLWLPFVRSWPVRGFSMIQAVVQVRWQADVGISEWTCKRRPHLPGEPALGSRDGGRRRAIMHSSSGERGSGRGFNVHLPGDSCSLWILMCLYGEILFSCRIFKYSGICRECLVRPPRQNGYVLSTREF